MNSTVAIALITSISTLAGASISGYITFLVSRTQGKNQLLLANTERMDQQLSAKRQIRRDAYVQYLNQLGKVEREFEIAWRSTPPGEPTTLTDFIAPINAELNTLKQIADIVLLEGSTRASQATMKLQAKLTLESVDVVNAAKNSNGDPLCLQDDQKYVKITMERASMKSELTKAAQEDLKDAPLVALPSTSS